MPSIKHGMHKTRTYSGWSQMKARVLNPNTVRYEKYGGAGISFDPKWIDFVGFYADMGERPKGMTLERINNAGNYNKANCKWATPKEQARNRSNSTSITFRGVTATLAEIVERFDTPPYQTIYARLRNGWSVEDALTVTDGRKHKCHS